MRSLKLCAAFLGSTVLLAGGTALAHPWEDTYHGPFELVGSVEGKQHGELKLELKHDGKLEGEGKNLDNHADFKFEGIVDEDGIFKGDIEGKGFHYHLEGTVFRTSHDHLKGTLLQFPNKDHSNGALIIDLEGDHHGMDKGHDKDHDKGHDRDHDRK
jgi:hypothetical protein